MNAWEQKQKGFTIVELLIVIVVIAILAAITIVAYNGIQNRAKQSAAQSTAKQAYTKIQSFAVQNADTYPSEAELESLGLATSEYQYSVSNTTSPRTFCLTATVQSISYRVTHSSSTPEAGGCSGHAQNGVATITNLLTNSGVELNTDNLQNIGSTGDRTIARTASTSAQSGDYVLRLTVGASGGVAGYGSNSPTVQPGRYMASLWIRSNVALVVNPYLEGSSTKTTISQQGATLVPNVWQRLWREVDVTAAGTIKVGFLGGGAGATAQNNWVEIDSFMLTSGSTLYTFADGSSSNWAWMGTPNASASLGIPL